MYVREKLSRLKKNVFDFKEVNCDRPDKIA